MAVVKKKTTKPNKKPPKRGKVVKNINLYKDNTNQKYLNYLKPSQVSILGSEYLRASGFCFLVVFGFGFNLLESYSGHERVYL